MRIIVYSAIGAMMAVQLMLLVCRDPFAVNTNDYPRMSLPVASHANRCCSWSVCNISWTYDKGWVAEGFGPIQEKNFDGFLKGLTERSNESGLVPIIRVRIPATASAGIIVDLTERMERNGIEQLRVAVIEPMRPRLIR